MNSLTPEQADAVQQVIEQVRQTGKHQSITLPDGSEAYAYPHTHGISWGVNSSASAFGLGWPSQCIARGLYRTERG